ncbi:Protein of unknown function [Lactobacillus helveticus CIRM-BIA 953]|uniref:Uncharacterized protein n=1 Tax=Lactobacillus helveticus CIRM-BIA 953 TaxID=1226335 RepID=U4QMN5_LACHE|nr:Protein of unknown function [Lactobacillus helveticus CIRM-BIA 953]CDI43356.1 Protein of unknown function [Lactobacillus helveticus CIRM-BIA 953]
MSGIEPGYKVPAIATVKKKFFQ